MPSFWYQSHKADSYLWVKFAIILHRHSYWRYRVITAFVKSTKRFVCQDIYYTFKTNLFSSYLLKHKVHNSPEGFSATAYYFWWFGFGVSKETRYHVGRLTHQRECAVSSHILPLACTSRTYRSSRCTDLLYRHLLPLRVWATIITCSTVPLHFCFVIVVFFLVPYPKGENGTLFISLWYPVHGSPSIRPSACRSVLPI